MTCLKPDRSRVIQQLNKELELAESFERNILNAADHFISHIGFDDGRDFAESVRFNQHYRSVHLERTAAILELVGCFDAANETADYATLSRKLNELANGERDHHEEA